MVGATQKGAWKPHWEARLTHRAHGVPGAVTELGLADRGEYARWLDQALVALGWHPLLRLTTGGQDRPQAATTVRSLAPICQHGGPAWCGRVTCCSSRAAQLDWTVLAQWHPPHTTPWVLLTDLPPETARLAWYGMRSWIERGLCTTKRGGWHWHQTTMTDPARAPRLWLGCILELCVGAKRLQKRRWHGILEAEVIGNQPEGDAHANESDEAYHTGGQ